MLILRHWYARHHEILPYHYAVLVAESVKLIIFIYAAAPDAQYVRVSVCVQRYRFFVSFGDPTVISVERHMVRAFAEHAHAVYHEAEIMILAKQTFGAYELCGAHSDIQSA